MRFTGLQLYMYLLIVVCLLYLVPNILILLLISQNPKHHIEIVHKSVHAIIFLLTMMQLNVHFRFVFELLFFFFCFLGFLFFLLVCFSGSGST